MKHLFNMLFNRNKPYWGVVVEGKFIYGGAWTYKQASLHAYIMEDSEVVYKPYTNR